jgi:hypothetical protein
MSGLVTPMCPLCFPQIKSKPNASPFETTGPQGFVFVRAPFHYTLFYSAVNVFCYHACKGTVGLVATATAMHASRDDLGS